MKDGGFYFWDQFLHRQDYRLVLSRIPSRLARKSLKLDHSFTSDFHHMQAGDIFGFLAWSRLMVLFSPIVGKRENSICCLQKPETSHSIGREDTSQYNSLFILLWLGSSVWLSYWLSLFSSEGNCLRIIRTSFSHHLSILFFIPILLHSKTRQIHMQ